MLARMVALVTSLVAASANAQAGTNAATSASPPSPVASAVVVPPLGVERTVPVASRALARGATITTADYLILATTVRPALRTAAPAEPGWVTRRPVAAGEPLVEPAVGPPSLVASGQPVTFVSGTSDVRISIRGTAASAGALGDLVWVRVDAGRRLRGVVTAPGTVHADTTSHR
jgi:flagella basal body P-ring formation protein FlgA